VNRCHPIALLISVLSAPRVSGPTSARQVPAAAPATAAADAQAQRVLTRAREALGGVGRLAAVRSLAVEGTRTRSPGSPYSEDDPYGFRLLLPDRYQSLASEFRHTLDGGKFWMNESVGDIPVDADVRTVAERSTRWNFMYHSLLFLLNMPADARAEFRYIGAMAEDPGNREWLEVTASGFTSTLRIGVDRSTGRPVVVKVAGSLGEAVDTLSGHRAVDGILFPFVIEDRLGDNDALTKISAIRVNSGVTAADFARR
jgi:hypothetical protein